MCVFWEEIVKGTREVTQNIQFILNGLRPFKILYETLHGEGNTSSILGVSGDGLAEVGGGMTSS